MLQVGQPGDLLVVGDAVAEQRGRLGHAEYVSTLPLQLNGVVLYERHPDEPDETCAHEELCLIKPCGLSIICRVGNRSPNANGVTVIRALFLND